MKDKRGPVESPARIVAFTNAIAALDWTPAAYQRSLEVLFRQLSELVQAEIEYYYARRCSSRRVSKTCRLLAWLAGTAGVMIPLVQPALGTSAPAQLLSWGYVAFGAAGAILIFDTVFAGTQAHQRYTATQLELEKIYTIFALEWQARQLDFEARRDNATARALIDRCISFATEMHRALGTETSAWQVTVNEALAELKGKISAGDLNGNRPQ